jgi:hypothetical protein
MDGGRGGPADHMNKRIFDIFVEELLAALPMAVIVTALTLLFCLILPPSFALPLCTCCMSIGVITSSHPALQLARILCTCSEDSHTLGGNLRECSHTFASNSTI